ncbi:MAG: hypothetical protein HN838_16330, partial [Rhodospirillaceae bacterium]|nr:hypothetical protein [Rhodospirillaceae bacterium]
MTDSSTRAANSRAQAFRAKWHEYYSEKRITHQWLQVDLLKSLPVHSVLEI